VLRPMRSCEVPRAGILNRIERAQILPAVLFLRVSRAGTWALALATCTALAPGVLLRPPKAWNCLNKLLLLGIDCTIFLRPAGASLKELFKTCRRGDGLDPCWSSNCCEAREALASRQAALTARPLSTSEETGPDIWKIGTFVVKKASTNCEQLPRYRSVLGAQL